MNSIGRQPAESSHHQLLRKRLALLTFALCSRRRTVRAVCGRIASNRTDLDPVHAGSAIVGALCAWGGLAAADRTRLPMPILRAWEAGQAADTSVLPRIVMFAVPVGIIAGLFAVGATALLGVPPDPGTLAVRLLTIPFAAIVTEVVAHLLVLRVLLLWLKKAWVALLLSSLIFVLIFHGQTFSSLQITLLVLATNFVFFTLTGWGYVRYGLVCAVLTYAIAHGIVLGFN